MAHHWCMEASDVLAHLVSVRRADYYSILVHPASQALAVVRPRDGANYRRQPLDSTRRALEQCKAWLFAAYRYHDTMYTV